MAFKSACIPAPPPESDPAIVYTIDGGTFGMMILSFADDDDEYEAANAVVDGNSLSIWPNRIVDKRRRQSCWRKKDRTSIVNLSMEASGCRSSYRLLK